jgi:hypothetical protein
MFSLYRSRFLKKRREMEGDHVRIAKREKRALDVQIRARG